MVGEEMKVESKMDEMQDYEVYENQEGHKISRYEITTYVTQRSVESLLKWVEKKKIVIPDFQRDYVWPKAVASKFIDSVLLNLPIPNIFLYKLYIDSEEVLYVVDGFQRIQTLKYYKDSIWSQRSDIKEGTYNSTEVKNEKFKINYKSSEWYGYSYGDLSQNDKFNFDEYSLNLTIFEQSNPRNMNSMFEIFERINTGSDKLSEQEIRNAIYPGEFLKYIREHSQRSSFKNVVEKDAFMKKRQNYVDLYLRFVSYYHAYNNNFDFPGIKITTSKRETLNNYCATFSELPQDVYKNYVNNIDTAIDIIYNFDKKAFYGKKRNDEEISEKIHAVFSEALVIAVIENNFNIKITPEEFNRFKIEFWGSENFERLFVQQTTTKENIVERIKLLIKVINNECDY